VIVFDSPPGPLPPPNILDKVRVFLSFFHLFLSFRLYVMFTSPAYPRTPWKRKPHLTLFLVPPLPSTHVRIPDGMKMGFFCLLFSLLPTGCVRDSWVFLSISLFPITMLHIVSPPCPTPRSISILIRTYIPLYRKCLVS